MKVIGSKIKNIEGLKLHQKVYIKANSKEIKDIKQDSTFGLMANTIQDNGSTIKNMEMEFGNLPTETSIWDSGSKAKFKAKVLISPRLDKSIRDSLPIF